MINEAVILQTLKCTKDQYPRILADKYPHVLEKIIAKWNARDFPAFMADLMQSNGRGGGRLDRDGFPQNAWQELYDLAELHKNSHSK